MTEIITLFHRIMGNVWDTEANPSSHMDVKSEFRLVGGAPDRAAAFAYRLKNLIFVDIRSQFG